MGNFRLSNLLHLLLAVSLLALAGCGTSNSVGSASGTGSVAAKLVWSEDAKTAKVAGKAVAAVPAGVSKMRLTVSGAGVPVVRNEIAVDQNTVSGSVSGIYPGNVSLVVQALNGAGAVLYEGFALNVVVTSGNETNVGTIYMSPPQVKAADTPCIGCHETSIDGNGQNLVAEFKQSGHYANVNFTDANGVAAGCAGCHGPSHNTPNPAEGAIASRCFECHTSSVASHNEYLKNGNECFNCHDMRNHDTTFRQAERVGWAQSGHAVIGGPFAGHNTGGCSRCHNPKGLIAILGDPTGASQPVVADPQNIGCNACHTNAMTGELRTLAGTTFTNYTGSTGWNPIGYTLNYGKKRYPDMGPSNICIQCHDSRQNDPGAITSATTAYTRTHYLQSATLMFVKMGFINFTTNTAQLNSLKSTQDGGTIGSTHRKLGTPGMINDHGITAQDTVFLSNGPCVTCHLAGSHSFKIDQAAITTICNRCHDAEGGYDITTIDAFREHFLNPQFEVYEEAIQLAIDLFNRKNTGVTIAPEEAGSEFVRPYLTSDLTKEATATNLTGIGSSWTAVAAAGGWDRTKLLGAIGNIILLKNEPAGYAHARTYTRRLLYDTIDFLDDGIMNYSVGATATAYKPAVYKKGAAAFTIQNGEPYQVAPGTSEAMTYLLKYSRSTGAWQSPERP